jgi:hypothetical protein
MVLARSNRKEKVGLGAIRADPCSIESYSDGRTSDQANRRMIANASRSTRPSAAPHYFLYHCDGRAFLVTEYNQFQEYIAKEFETWGINWESYCCLEIPRLWQGADSPRPL